MRIDNTFDRSELASIARSKARDYESRTVANSDVDDLVADGWAVAYAGKKRTRLQRTKRSGPLWEDRVWTFLYRLGFQVLSGDRGAWLLPSPDDQPNLLNQIDAVAIDDEVAVAFECKYSEASSKRTQFQEEIGKLNLLRPAFTTAVRRQFPSTAKRPIVFAMFLHHAVLSPNDKARAEQANVLIFDEHDLTYYEMLVDHIGPAARYQFLADLLPHKTVPGIEIRVPAVKNKMGGNTCFTFCMTPAYLLKIAYVSHRSKGKPSDVDAYQRMLKKARLKNIRKYIQNDGIFPTNIVLNFEKNRLRFEKSTQEASDRDAGVLGWLDIKAAYKSAWIIDGQHRLFAYSGLEEGLTSKLSILAFEGLRPSEQAKLFIDINAEQKGVKQSLLQELYAELNWNSEMPEERIAAVISKAVQVLGNDRGSPFFHRIQMADDAQDELRCISIRTLFSSIDKGQFYFSRGRQDTRIADGVFYDDDNSKSVERTVHILKSWFERLSIPVKEWWDKGRGDGGGLAMNDSIAALIRVLASVCQHFDQAKLRVLDDDDFAALIRPYADAVGGYFAGLTETERKAYRDLRGDQGQVYRARQCQIALRKQFPEFRPEGLEKFVEEISKQTNLRGKEIVDRIEIALKKYVLEELHKEYSSNDQQWWVMGIPGPVRIDVSERFEKTDGAHGQRENYFTFIHYEKIALHNWESFGKNLAETSSGKKEARLSWINFVNQKRNIVSHASSGQTLSLEDVGRLEDIDNWLKHVIEPAGFGA